MTGRTVDFAIALREPGQPLRIEHDRHPFGVFPDATWRRLIDDSGLERVDVDVDDPMQTSTWWSWSIEVGFANRLVRSGKTAHDGHLNFMF